MFALIGPARPIWSSSPVTVSPPAATAALTTVRIAASASVTAGTIVAIERMAASISDSAAVASTRAASHCARLDGPAAMALASWVRFVLAFVRWVPASVPAALARSAAPAPGRRMRSRCSASGARLLSSASSRRLAKSSKAVRSADSRSDAMGAPGAAVERTAGGVHDVAEGPDVVGEAVQSDGGVAGALARRTDEGGHGRRHPGDDVRPRLLLDDVDAGIGGLYGHESLPRWCGTVVPVRVNLRRSLAERMKRHASHQRQSGSSGCQELGLVYLTSGLL